MKNFTSVLTVLFCVLTFGISYSQVLQKKTTLKKQVENSHLVVEGKVVAKRSFFDSERGLIYTSNTVEIYKVFKGEALKTVDVITLGGTVGLRALVANPSLKLYQGDIGVFLLQNSNVSNKLNDKSGIREYRPHSSSQGFYRYNLVTDLASNAVVKKKGIEASFYQELISLTKRDYLEMNKFHVNPAKKVTSKVLQTPGSLTLNKSVATAGTKDVLTITGSGFGATKGKVYFSNADDGGVTLIPALDSQVLTWGDTEITVEIPSSAGTGPIVVEDAMTPANQSPPSSTLTISYAEINVPSDPGTGVVDYQVQHVDDNDSGGYTWQMYTDFFNDTEYPGAKAAFERAFNNWVCETGINWEISSTATTTDLRASDGINIIRFDNGSELEDDTMNDGILGVCYSSYLICSSTPAKVFVSEMDIIFNDDIDNDGTVGTLESWYFGTGSPGFSEYDFESVALHELGHGHQLGHVIDDTNDVMHYSISNGESQRVIGSGNSTAANNIQTRSTGDVILCTGVDLMSDASCPLSIGEFTLNDMVKVFPNPSKGKFQIDALGVVLEKVEIYDLSGRQIVVQDLKNTPRIKDIDLLSISSGIYLMNIHSETTMVTRKIVIE